MEAGGEGGRMGAGTSAGAGGGVGTGGAASTDQGASQSGRDLQHDAHSASLPEGVPPRLEAVAPEGRAAATAENAPRGPFRAHLFVLGTH
eukprot:scaffold45614_cov16-Tisochrysis_lutea.AAC.4